MTAKNSLRLAQQFAATRRWYTLPLLPLTKLPAAGDYYSKATLDADGLERLWAGGRRYAESLNAQHPDYVNVKNKDVVKAVQKAREFDAEWYTREPGIGVNLAASNLVAVDVDTIPQQRIWQALCEANGYDPGPHTVASPGVLNPDGTAKHDGLGHYYFDLPSDLRDANRSNSAVNLLIGIAEDGDEEEKDRPALMAGRRFLVLPPTQRPEGFYVRSEDADVRQLPPFLAEILRTTYEKRRLNKQRSEELAARMVREDSLWRWDMDTPWADVLPSDWTLTGSDGVCEVYAHPLSTRSAVAHAPGCPHLGGDDEAVTPPPITFHTTTVPDYIANALKRSGGQSLSKLTLYAAKEHDGNVRAARRSLGLPDSAPRRHAPTSDSPARSTLPHNQVLRVKRPLPDYTKVSTPAPQVSVETVTVTVAALAPALSEEPEATAEVRSSTPAASPEPEKVVESSAQRLEVSFEDVDMESLDAIAPWSVDHPMNRLFAFVKQQAVPTSRTALNELLRRESIAGGFMGHPTKPDTWTRRHKEMRDNRSSLVGIEHFTNMEAAELLGVSPHRAQSWLRALIPILQRAGVLLREREDDKQFDTYSDKATASVNTRWAAWQLAE